MNPEDLFFGFTDDDFNWLDLLAGAGSIGGDLGGWLFDTDTGQFVPADGIDPALIDTLDYPVSNVSGGPTGTSLSDQLRSREADVNTPGSEPFHGLTADPMSIASGSMDWGKALSGLGGLGSALGKGLSGLAGNTPGLLGVNGGPISTALSAPSLGGVAGAGGMMASTSGGGDFGGGPPSVHAPDQVRLGMTDPITAALMHLQADPGTRIAVQSPLPMREPIPFTPLTITQPTPSGPMAAAPAPRLSGLQRLALERLG